MITGAAAGRPVPVRRTLTAGHPREPAAKGNERILCPALPTAAPPLKRSRQQPGKGRMKRVRWRWRALPSGRSPRTVTRVAWSGGLTSEALPPSGTAVAAVSPGGGTAGRVTGAVAPRNLALSHISRDGNNTAGGSADRDRSWVKTGNRPRSEGRIPLYDLFCPPRIPGVPEIVGHPRRISPRLTHDPWRGCRAGRHHPAMSETEPAHWP
jgi:hypothetical protein